MWNNNMGATTILGLATGVTTPGCGGGFQRYRVWFIKKVVTFREQLFPEQPEICSGNHCTLFLNVVAHQPRE